MPAKSKAQQQAAARALAAKRGQADPRDLSGGASSMYRSMSEEMLEDFAAEVEDLPERKG